MEFNLTAAQARQITLDCKMLATLPERWRAVMTDIRAAALLGHNCLVAILEKDVCDELEKFGYCVKHGCFLGYGLPARVKIEW